MPATLLKSIMLRIFLLLNLSLKFIGKLRHEYRVESVNWQIGKSFSHGLGPIGVRVPIFRRHVVAVITGVRMERFIQLCIELWRE